MSPETQLAEGQTVLEVAKKISDEANGLQKLAGEATATVNETVQHSLRSKMKKLYGEEAQLAQASDLDDLVNVNILDSRPKLTPNNLEALLPMSAESASTTRQSRTNISKILRGEDDRLVAIVGPCSIHDPEAALEYADHISVWREQFGHALEIVMRMYVEKPRTVIGWKGLVNDPRLNESYDANTGLVAARMLFCQTTHKGVPTATEYLSPDVPQYLNGLISYGAIGARDASSQVARSRASGVSTAMGIKNPESGRVQTAIEAVQSVNAPHSFSGCGMNGLPETVQSTGNPLAHVILRGGDTGPNYSSIWVQYAKGNLRANELLDAIVIDASHGNSGKQAAMQMKVIRSVARQVTEGEASIKGVMIESNLVAGRQDLVKGHENDLEYGVSITDECVGLEETEEMLTLLAGAVRVGR